jgi:uncharacterized membrane protein
VDVVGSAMGLGFAIVGLTFLMIIVITGLTIGVIVWAFRRTLPRAEDPAVAELKRRLATGEISPVEYEVRMRALQQGD